MSEILGPLTREQVKAFLPQRDPFLFVDEVTEINRTSLSIKMGREHIGTTVLATKQVRREEPHFEGHFPGHPIMPGVLMIEAMAQAAIFSFYPKDPNEAGFTKKYSVFLVGTEGMRFRRVVVPGDVLTIKTTLTKSHSSMVVFKCSIEVNGERTAEGTLLSQVKEMT